MHSSLNTLSFAANPVIAQITTTAGLKDALGSVIGLLVIFSYVAALIIFIMGIMKKENDPAAGAAAIKTAAWLAAGTTVVTILFFIFGQSGATVAPNFS